VKESYIGFSISVIIHLFIISFMVIVPLRMQPLTKTILVDFTLIKGQGVESREQRAKSSGSSEDSRQGPGAIRKADGHSTRTTDYYSPFFTEQRVQSSEEKVQKTIETNLIASDPEGQVQVHREVSSGKDSMLMGQGSAQKEKNVAGLSGTTGGGQGRALGYGDGNTDDKTFFYIRENIMKNIKYPEKARRMGWEGKVLLSFVIFENGSIHNIKVVNSSGFPVLDSSAREAIAKTTFSQKVPYRLVIVLPIEYKLE
jgi:protein TonB